MKNLFIPLLACITCAVIVSFTAVSVRSTQELNLENDKKSKILLAAGINSENINEEFEKIENIFLFPPKSALLKMSQVSRLHKLTGFVPSTCIEEGIPKFISWYRTFHN